MLFQSLKGGRTINILNIGLGVLLLASVLFLLRDVVSSSFGGRRPGPVVDGGIKPKVASSRVRAEFGSYSPILENNVFGFDAGALKLLSGGASLQVGEGPAVGLSGGELRLLGTVAWPDGVGYAFISGRSGEAEVYRTGQVLEGVGRLIDVSAAGARIEGGAGDIVLELASIGDSAPPIERGVGRAPSDFARRTSENSYVLDKQTVLGSLDNPKNIMTDARLLPNIVDGEQKGFVVKEVKPRGLYYSLGIRNGDVLLRVNEFDISDAETALQAFNALKGMDRIALDILREGNKQTLTYEIR